VSNRRGVECRGSVKQSVQVSLDMIKEVETHISRADKFFTVVCLECALS